MRIKVRQVIRSNNKIPFSASSLEQISLGQTCETKYKRKFVPEKFAQTYNITYCFSSFGAICCLFRWLHACRSVCTFSWCCNSLLGISGHSTCLREEVRTKFLFYTHSQNKQEEALEWTVDCVYR